LLETGTLPTITEVWTPRSRFQFFKVIRPLRFFLLEMLKFTSYFDDSHSSSQLHRLVSLEGRGAARLQTLMFSATLHSPEILALSKVMCSFPTWVDLKGRDSVPDTVKHLLVPIDPTRDAALWANMRPLPPNDQVHARDGAAPSSHAPESRSLGIKCLKLLRLVELIDALKMSQCLIFCRTNLDCDNLEKFLIARGGGKAFAGRVEKGTENPYSCCVLAGMRSMEERRRNLQFFKDGDVRFLICTDVAARGLDIKNLPFVINLTLPDVAENYIHRIGRVGRADSIGLAVSFVAVEKEKVRAVSTHSTSYRSRKSHAQHIMHQSHLYEEIDFNFENIALCCVFNICQGLVPLLRLQRP
jgi:ATP-dependent RNA helicase DDX1